MEFLELPLELQTYIIEWMDITSVETLSACSRQYHDILEYECIWKHKFIRLMGTTYDTIEQFNTLNCSSFNNFYEVYKFSIKINVGWTHSLCSLGYVELFKYCYNDEDDDDTLEKYLSISVSNHRYNMIKFLLGVGVIPTDTHVLECGMSGDIPSVELILGFNPDFNECLLGAAIGNHAHVAEMLIHKGADNINIALGYALSKNNIQVAQYLIQQGADVLCMYDPRTGNNSCRDVLGYLVESGNLETIKYIVDRGLKLKDYLNYGWLNTALDNRDYEMVKYLLQHGFIFNISKVTLPILTTNKDVDIVHYMLKHSG